MKKGTTLLSLTILSLGVYRFSQGFLRQQVQQVTAATVAVGQPVQSVPITGGEINITVKSYPKATTINRVIQANRNNRARQRKNPLDNNSVRRRLNRLSEQR